MLRQKATLMGGDALWAARARNGGNVWALDWIVERKSVKDLAQSIRAVRYEGQKYFLRRCGLRRLMYLIEGSLEAQDGVRACQMSSQVGIHKRTKRRCQRKWCLSFLVQSCCVERRLCQHCFFILCSCLIWSSKRQLGLLFAILSSQGCCLRTALQSKLACVAMALPKNDALGIADTGKGSLYLLTPHLYTHQERIIPPPLA